MELNIELEKLFPTIYDPIVDDVLENQKFKHYILKGGRSSVKGSTAYSLAILKCLIEQKDLFVFVPSQELISDGCFNQVQNCLQRMGFDFEPSQNPYRIKIGKLCIRFKGLDANNSKKQSEFFKGFETVNGISAVVFDEMIASDDPFLQQRINTIIDTTIRNNPIYFYVFNPPKNKSHWVFKFLETEKKKENSIIVHSTIYDLVGERHTFLDDIVLESANQLKGHDEKSWRHRFLGEAVGVEGLFFPNFNKEQILIDSNRLKKTNIEIIVIGVDYGEQNATTFNAWAATRNGNAVKLSSWYYSGRDNHGEELGVEVYARAFKKWFLALQKEWGGVSSVRVDPSAKALKIAIEKEIGYGLVDKANNKRIEGWAILKWLVAEKRFFFLDKPEMQKGIEEYENAVYDATTISKTKPSGEDMLKINDHILDSDRYALKTLVVEVGWI